MNKTLKGVKRLSGLDRVDTAIKIAKEEYKGKVKNVVLATADNCYDALLGSMLAYKVNAPVLLVESTDAQVQKVINYMKSNMESNGTVYILGGTGAISSKVKNKIISAGFTSIVALGGEDKYKTAVKIADSLNVQERKPLILVNGSDYPGLLTISSVAAEMGMAILLVDKDGMSDSIKNEIAKIKPSRIYAIGLEGIMPEHVLNEAASIAKSTTVRIGTVNRYKTSIEIAKYFDLSGHGVCIVKGNDFTDALAGSVYAAGHNVSIILVGSSLSDDAINYLKTINISGLTIFGDRKMVSKAVEERLSQFIKK